MHLQPARAERARPAAVRSELVERRTSAEAKSEGALERGSGRAEGANPREFCRRITFEGARQHLIPSKQPDADDSAVPERSHQPERSAKRGATAPGVGPRRTDRWSAGSEPSGALSPERWGWGPAALIEERGEP
jgi:hypothetical protein